MSKGSKACACSSKSSETGQKDHSNIHNLQHKLGKGYSSNSRSKKRKNSNACKPEDKRPG